jgi:hypothetical protein
MIHMLSYGEFSLRYKSHALGYYFIVQDDDVCTIDILYAYNKRIML